MLCELLALELDEVEAVGMPVELDEPPAAVLVEAPEVAVPLLTSLALAALGIADLMTSEPATGLFDSIFTVALPPLRCWVFFNTSEN